MIAPLQTAVPATWEGRVATLADALRGYTTGGHHLSLGLSGALLRRGVAPDAVPAIVEAATARAGWGAPRACHYHRNASDTVHRWGAGKPIRSDVPPELVPVLDAITGSTTPTHDLRTEQARLSDALRQAPDGLSCIKAPCGLGKTRAARLLAAERHAQGLRTTISVPTNELAEQVTADLRAAGVPVLRIFGPTSVPGEHDGWACAYHAAASQLANGWQSVRWELCEGRRREPCPYRETCPAAGGADGPADALVIVGNHGLLGELDRVTGTRGLLIIDEPPHVLDDQVLTDDDLVEAYDQLGRFEEGHRFAPAVALARAVLAEAALDTPLNLADVDLPVPAALLEEAGAEDVASAVAGTIPSHARAPVIDRTTLITSRSDPTRAGRLGRASRVLTVLYRALTDAGMRTQVFAAYRTQERRLSVVGVGGMLHGALRRDGSVVVMAADADLYLDHYAAVVGYQPPITHLNAPDGCQVRRVLLERRFGRRRRPGPEVLRAALELTTGHAAVVTFKAWTSWARKHAAAWGADRGRPVPDVGHYGALRGLDHWRGHDALVTFGDPIQNLGAVARATDDDVHARANALARAELEQAHGRLRLVHRTAPATCVHVGRLVPAGWPSMVVERHEQPVGRPPRPAIDPNVVAQAIDEAGGVRALGRMLAVSHTTVRRWLEGRGSPPSKVAASLLTVAQGGGATSVRND